MKIKKEKYYMIYKITNLINHKFYIGMHYGFIEDGYLGSGSLLHEAYDKYGLENFTKKELIEKCNSLDHMKEREIFWIKELNSLVPNGYNIQIGGDGGDRISHNPNRENILKKIAASSKEMWKRPERKLQQQIAVSGTKNGRYKDGTQSTEFHRQKIENKIKLNEYRKEIVLKLWKTHSKQEISEILNIGHSILSRLINELGLNKIKRKRVYGKDSNISDVRRNIALNRKWWHSPDNLKAKFSKVCPDGWLPGRLKLKRVK